MFLVVAVGVVVGLNRNAIQREKREGALQDLSFGAYTSL
jgi:hypothetical protein